MSYTYLTIHQRVKIETLHAEGLATQQIASRIHVHHATWESPLRRFIRGYIKGELSVSLQVLRRKGASHTPLETCDTF